MIYPDTKPGEITHPAYTHPPLLHRSRQGYVGKLYFPQHLFQLFFKLASSATHNRLHSSRGIRLVVFKL